MMTTANEDRIDIKLLHEPVCDVGWDVFPQPAGAECAFLGRTRSETHPEHGTLRSLRYEAYEPMAEQVLRSLADQAMERFNCLAVRIHHAVCDVPIGEASVCVNVVAGHRDKAFEACRFLIDALKMHAPIWKKEIWQDGTSWAQGSLPTSAAIEPKSQNETARRDDSSARK